MAIWRDLKRTGAFYLQQAVCILPARPETTQAVADIRARIADLGGSCNFFTIDAMEPEQEAQIIDGFKDLAAREYAEIVEECDTKFVKEIEFERFRENYTFEEAEEIRQDLEKIHRWFQRVTERDWFGGDGQETAAAKIENCERLLEQFEEDVYERVGGAEATPSS
ncbi:MAG: Chromate resistance protein ChrB [Dehalococcoidia bacterium]